MSRYKGTLQQVNTLLDGKIKPQDYYKATLHNTFILSGTMKEVATLNDPKLGSFILGITRLSGGV